MSNQKFSATIAEPEIEALETGPAEGLVTVYPAQTYITIATIICSDLVAILLACSTAVAMRYLIAQDYRPLDYVRLLPLLLLFPLVFTFMGLYPGIIINVVEEIRRMVNAVTCAFLLLGASTFLTKETGGIYSRAAFLAALPICIITVMGARLMTRHFFGKRRWWGIPAVIMGAGRTAEILLNRLLKNPALGLKVVAILDDDCDPGTDVAGIPVLGGLPLAPELIERYGISYGILAMPSLRGPQIASLIEKYGAKFRHLLIIPDLFGISSLWVNAKDLGGILGLEVNQVLLRPAPRTLKRAFDLAATSLGLFLTAPLFLLIALAVKLTSPGPIFYQHMRHGRNGNLFGAWKFRSMYTNGDGILRSKLSSDSRLRDEWNRDHKLKKDPRLTPLGSLLRRTSLDELPQLFNVITGEMSLVGPRPIVPNEITKYGDRFFVFCSVQPGLTGMWQISGRNDTTFQERIELNEYYIRNWSIWLDLYILIRTIDAVVLARGAY